MCNSYPNISPNNPSNMDFEDGQSDHEDTANLAGPFDDSEPSDLVDIAPVPEVYLAEIGDRVAQSAVLRNINENMLYDPADIDRFNEKAVYKLSLSRLQKSYDNKDRHVINLLSKRNKIYIDPKFMLEFGNREIYMDTTQTMIDYQLVVSNSIGFSILLPNAENDHRFKFDMDLKSPQKQFKGKHGMVGFDTKGRMLYLGRANNEDVYLAMAPNDFLGGTSELCAAGHSTGSSVMSRRHYRQMVMMFAHFVADIPSLAYDTLGNIYRLDLEEKSPAWWTITNIM
jgi:hypothetical protein